MNGFRSLRFRKKGVNCTGVGQYRMGVGECKNVYEGYSRY